MAVDRVFAVIMYADLECSVLFRFVECVICLFSANKVSSVRLQ